MEIDWVLNVVDLVTFCIEINEILNLYMLQKKNIKIRKVKFFFKFFQKFDLNIS